MRTHYKILCKPKNMTYIDAFEPRIIDNHMFWYDDNDRERAAKIENLKIHENGVWNFFNPDMKEEITFVPVGFIKERYWEDKEDFKIVCRQPAKDKVYFRPFLCKGNPCEADIFIVGINPATPISDKQLLEDEYVDKLFNYDVFLDWYKKYRKSEGTKKKTISDTRQGIDAFGHWLNEITGSVILETNVSSYPTSRAKELYKEPDYIQVQSKEMFRKLLNGIKPSIIILHGKDTVDEFIKALKSLPFDLPMQNINSFRKQKIGELEKESPLFTFGYNDGNECTVFACRHLMHYKATGKDYGEFRKKIMIQLSTVSCHGSKSMKV